MWIIGYGNPQRGDDAAGILVAQKLQQRGILAHVHMGEPLSLIDAWKDKDDVVIIDAVRTGAEVGTIYLWDVSRESVSSGVPTSTHGFDVAEALALARVLNRLPHRLRVYGIEGRQFGIGISVSPEVKGAVDKVATCIAGESANAELSPMLPDDPPLPRPRRD